MPTNESISIEEKITKLIFEKSEAMINEKGNAWISQHSDKENDRKLSATFYSANFAQFFFFLRDYCESLGLVCKSHIWQQDNITVTVKFPIAHLNINMWSKFHERMWNASISFGSISYNIPQNFPFFCSLITNIKRDEHELNGALLNISETIKKKSKNKGIAIKTMTVLIQNVLSKMQYSWELLVSERSFHKLRIKIDGSRVFEFDIKENNYVKTIQEIPKLIDEIKNLEKKYHTKLFIKDYTSKTDGVFKNTYRITN